MNAYKYLKKRCQVEGAIFSTAQRQGNGQWVQTGTQEITGKYEKYFLYFEGYTANYPEGCRDSRNIQNLPLRFLAQLTVWNMLQQEGLDQMDSKGPFQLL